MTDAYRPVRDPMSRERWMRLSPLIDAALDLAPAERDGYCERIAADDPALGSELRRLIGQLEGGEGLLSAAALERFVLLSDDEPVPPPATDLLQQLQTSLGTAYRLERELGGGGMSRVFIADEPGLGRQVVIKVLKPELSAGINADRFTREIRLAASLQQANIVPLLSAGTAAGFPYYTMPLVEGRSLRERLARDGALPDRRGGERPARCGPRARLRARSRRRTSRHQAGQRAALGRDGRGHRLRDCEGDRGVSLRRGNGR